MTLLGKIDHIRHLRRFAHSHSCTPGFFFLSPVCQSCVDKATQRKKNHALRTWDKLAIRSCSRLEHFARSSEYASGSCVSAPFPERGEASDGNQNDGRDPDQRNHLFSSSSQLRKRGAFVCVHYRGRPLARLWKLSGQTDGIPTKWSARFFLKSLQHFGRRTPRQILRLLQNARCALLSAISAASEIGPVTPSRPSSPKFSVVTQCETSRSVHGHKRRAF